MSTIYTLNGKVLKNSANDKWLIKHVPVDPYNPLGLPPFTIRCKFKSGYTPTMGNSQTLVDAGENIWDITKNSTNWHGGYSSTSWITNNVISVLGANTTGVTNMYNTFKGCTNLTSVVLFDTSSCTNMQSTFSGCSSLTSIPLFDTSSVTGMGYMFSGCSSLTSIPLFDTSSCTNMQNLFEDCRAITSVPLFDTSKVTSVQYMFLGCYKVESGALSLYQQMSTQSNPPAAHLGCFSDCGRDTVTGAAELAQIPSSWGGTGA